MAIVTNIYPNFQAALAACGEGYNAGDIADIIAFKAARPVEKLEIAPEQAINSILAVGIAAAELSARPLTVVDFGGGCGFHYFRVKPAVTMPLQWAIVETPTMAERAAKIGQGQFEVYTQIADATKALGRVDLVHASGTIQYVPDPLATLRALAALKAPYIMIARFPLWHRAQIVGVQVSTLASNGIGPMPPNIPDRRVEYPVTFINYIEMTRALEHYDVVLAIQSPSSNYTVAGEPVPGATVIFRIKDLAAR